jgi:hypothetical protein
MKKTRKSPLFAAIINFLFWGIGYLYLEEKMEKAFYMLVAFFSFWIMSFWYITIAGPLEFAGLFWIITWYMIISFYIGADAYIIGGLRK